MQTETPNLTITPELIYTLANVSALVNAKWYLGALSLPSLHYLVLIAPVCDLPLPASGDPAR